MEMIYVSSSAISSMTAMEAIKSLIKLGYKNIELSGGTRPVPTLKDQLIELKMRYDLHLICHNYFPPPKDDFVLNLASLDDEIFKRTLDHFEQSIEFSKALGATSFGLHAGFLLDLEPRELGGRMRSKEVYNKELCLRRFCDGYERLSHRAESVKLYVENNVISRSNLEAFGGVNPLMLTKFEDYLELIKRIKFNFLLDVGHLKVSSNSLQLDFADEFQKFWPCSDYVHISDNDGVSDQHHGISEEGDLFLLLRRFGICGKTVTLEINQADLALRNSYRLLEGLL